MPQFRFHPAAAVLVLGLSLGACSTYGYDGYGNNGYGYNGYGYQSGLSVGYSNSPYWGWNDGYYYPGTGYYVYDSYRRPTRWNGVQQSYWTNRQTSWRGHDRRAMRENWRDFRRDRRH